MRNTLRLSAVMVISLALACAGCKSTGGPANSSSNPNAGANNSSAPNSDSSSANSNQPGANGSDNGSSAAAANNGQQAPAPHPIVLRAGRVITIRLSQPLSSKDSQPGQAFSGSVAEPIEVDGRTVIQRGAAAHGTVVDAKAMGHFKGGALLQLELNSVTINGERRPVEAAWSQTLKGKGKRTAVAVGGGAGLGALIGGLAGGGKGAAIGAVAGGGAGTAGAAYTGNKEIQLAAESAVSFTLKQSVHVQ